MKKVGIITFHDSLNCGSMLQAYALQKTLSILGVDNEIIDFSNEGSREMYSITPSLLIDGKLRVMRIIKCFMFLLYRDVLKKQRESFVLFKKQYLKLSQHSYKSDSELCSEDFNYSHFITGSDQVWNILCRDADDAYFLNFVKRGKKIAYAVSLGATIIKDKAADVNKYRNYIKAFDYISVRENNSVRQISELREKNDVKLLVDPTLLLFKEDWEKCFDLTKPVVKGDYIVYYAFSYPSEVNSIVRKISDKLKMPVYILDATSWGPYNIRINGFKLCPEFGPKAFLNLMKYAKLSLTTSFHGTVFSVIFEKPFWFINSSMHNATDDRAESLLNQLGLIDHYKKGHELLNTNIFSPIDYGMVNNRRKELRDNSRDFLLQCVS